jgi:hypothetical protein
LRKAICNTLFVAAAAVMFTSCSGDEEVKDDQFCACLSATEDLNEVSSTLMEGGITEENRQEVKELRAKKDKLCKDYEMLSGDENRKKMELCEGKSE